MSEIVNLNVAGIGSAPHVVRLQDLPYEHPEDVFAVLIEAHDANVGAALVIVSNTVGGAVREAGAVMAVLADGRRAGYISGGCIDEDVAAHAVQAMNDIKPKKLLYGAGSPFIDLPLPCGGAIEITIVPHPEITAIKCVYKALLNRCSQFLRVGADGALEAMAQSGSQGLTDTDLMLRYQPKMRLRIAGRGADCIALAHLANAGGIKVEFQSTDESEVRYAERLNLARTTHLATPSTPPLCNDDAFTAVSLMFHDQSWEPILLQQALANAAFYVGAVGSQTTHQKRCVGLAQLGVPKSDIERIHGPIGLVPSLRNASGLAISILAEIIGVFSKVSEPLIADRA